MEQPPSELRTVLCNVNEMLLSCRSEQCGAYADRGILVRGGGGPGQSDKKSSDNFFFSVLNLFYRSQMVNFKEIYHFSRFQRGGGPTFSRGVQLFPGGVGSNCLFPIETHIDCDFPGGGGSGPPVPPLESALAGGQTRF